jgi:uncharacterized membrane protein (UPF0127 family)
MTRRSIFIILLAVVIVLGGTATLTASLTSLQRFSVRSILLRPPKGESMLLSVEIAETEAQHEQGLMFRHSVKRGMLFVFSDSRFRAFWMKNTWVALDIAFFAQDGSFVSSASMQPCTADPCPSYSSGGAAKYALEMPEGFLKDKKIGKGWTLQVPRLARARHGNP